jgi:hypothetical protein
MTRRFAGRWPRPARTPWCPRTPGRRTLWRPRTRRGWLITVALAGIALAVKLTIGLGLVLLLLRHLLH